MGDGHDYQTEAEVRVIVNDTLKQWERDYGEKRHEANLQKFDEVFAAINQVRGVGLFLGVVLIALQIWRITTGK